MELRSGRQCMKRKHYDYDDQNKVMWQYEPVNKKTSQERSMFFYLWNQTEAFRKCIIYNILTDRSGVYAARLAQTCQALANHGHDIHIANMRRKYNNANHGCNMKEVRNFIKNMMIATRIMLNWRAYDWHGWQTHRWLAIPLIRKAWKAWTPRRGTIYIPVSFNSEGDASIVMLYADEFHGIPQVGSRFDAWQQCREQYSEDMGNYMHSLLRMGNAHWTSFIPCRTAISVWKRQHKYSKACNMICHCHNIPDDYQSTLVGVVIPRSAMGKDCIYIEERGSDNIRWVVSKATGEQMWVYY